MIVRRTIKIVFLQLAAAALCCSTALGELGGCPDPTHRALRQRLEQESDRLKDEIKRTGNCALIPKYIAFYVQADAQLQQSIRKIKGCWMVPSDSPAEVENRLRRDCREEQKKPSQDFVRPSSNPFARPPTGSASCSDITGTNSTTPAAKQCGTARKAVDTARADRKKYPELAAKKYREAAEAYRQAGDHTRAALVLQEAEASDPTPFIAAEQSLAQRKQNLVEADNNLQIARKIEAGAFESHSCGDLKRAADYYFTAAKYFLRGNQFATFNAVALHRDHLERLVDEAKAKGLCDKKVLATRRTVSTPSAPPEEALLSADQCRATLAQIKQTPDLLDAVWSGPLMVELAARGCKDPQNPVPTSYQCITAKLAWEEKGLGVEETMRRLGAGNCACTVRGDSIRCASHRPDRSPAQPLPSTTPTANSDECRKLLDFIQNAPNIMKGVTGEALKYELRKNGCRVP